MELAGYVHLYFRRHEQLSFDLETQVGSSFPVKANICMLLLN